MLEVCWLKEKSGAVNISYLFDLRDIGMGKTTADSVQELIWLQFQVKPNALRWLSCAQDKGNQILCPLQNNSLLGRYCN